MAEASSVFVAAVQTRLEIEPYRTAEGFAEWVLEQARTALRGRDPAEPALVAYPELVGLPLLFHLGGGRSASVAEAVWTTVRSGWRGLPAAARGRNLGPSAFLLAGAPRLYSAYKTAFSQVARETNSHVVAGSIFLPGVEEEAALGLHLADARVQNVSFAFAPSGAVIGRTPKLNLTAGLERRLGLARGRPEEVIVQRTALGGLCTLVCYDAFFERPLERLDGLGGTVLVQPSANARPWNGPWSADPALVEGEEWLRRGPAARLQGRSNLRCVVNPMLVGRMLDLSFEGRSSVAVNRDLLPGLTAVENGLLALAPTPDEFAVVTARLPGLEP